MFRPRGSLGIDSIAAAVLKPAAREEEEKAPLQNVELLDSEEFSRTQAGFLLPCVPARRDVILAGLVPDGSQSAVVEEAEYLPWATAAALSLFLGR